MLDISLSRFQNTSNFLYVFTDPTPLMFYTTPETSSESSRLSSVGYEADIARTSNISQENIQYNTVDTSKWSELLEEKGSAPMSGRNTLDDYGKDISLIQTSAETSDEKKNDRDKLHKDNTESYDESTIIGETSKTEGNYKAKLQEDNTEIYTESTGTNEESTRQENHKEGIQGNIEFYTESTHTGATSKRESNDKLELQQDTTEVYNESTGTGEMNEREGSNKEDLQQGNTEAYTESTGAGQTGRIEENDKVELPNNPEAYIEGAGTGETIKRQGSDKEEEQDKIQVYNESTGTKEMSKIEGNKKEELQQDTTEVYNESTDTGETSKTEGSNKEEMQQDNTDFYDESIGIRQRSKIEEKNKEEQQGNTEVYTEVTGNGETREMEGNDRGEAQGNTESYGDSTGTGETSKIKGNDKGVQVNTEVYTENTDTGETRKIEGNDKGEAQDNTEAYTESTGTGEASKIDGQEKEEIQVKSEVYTENAGTGERSKMEGNDKEMQQDNTEIYAASTATGEASKKEKNDKEELQKDDTEVYVENTGTGETRKREGNVKEELQEDGTDVLTESPGSPVPTHRSEEDKTDTSSGKITNKASETWFGETATAPNHHILESEGAKNNDNLDGEVSSTHATKTEDNDMVKDGGAVWYIGEVRESSTETIMYETSQETETHEITRNISEHNEGGSGTDPTQYETSVNNREGIVTGSTGGDDDIESLTGSGETDQGNYHEDNTEAGNIEDSNTTAVPDKYTQLTEHESKDTVPVVTFQSNMELHQMDLVVPGLDNTKLQVDYDINTTEENPVFVIDSDINAISEYSSATNIPNITDFSSADDLNTSGLEDKTFHNSSEESENVNKGGSSTSSLTISTASLTTYPTTDITSDLQNTERKESSEPTTVQSETVYSRKNHLLVASLLMHDSATKTQNEEITSSTVDSTTPDILEGEHPSNTQESEQRTEQTEASVTETLQDVTAANSISDSNNMQESKKVPHISDEGVSHTVQNSESTTESDWNTAPEEETEKSVNFTAGAAEASEKILGTVGAFKNNKTANTTETSDILPKEWLKTQQVTTVTNPDAVRMDEDKSQTVFSHDKAEEFTSTVNYINDEGKYLYESRSGDRTDPPKETDTTNTDWATETTSATSISSANTDKIHDDPSNENNSQMLVHDVFNGNQSDKENGTDNASEEMNETTGEQGISTTIYNSHEREMPFWHELFSQHSKKHNEMEGSDTSTTDTISQGDPGFTGGGILGGPGENDSWISDAVRKSWNKQSNTFEKNYPESFGTEDKSTDDEQHGSDEPVFIKQVQSAVYSSSSYEMNSHDFYGIGDYYVSSSESGLTYNMTNVHSEATSPVTSTSSEEQSTDLTTASSRDNDNEGSSGQEYTNNETTMKLIESAETNRTETALESTTPGRLENIHSSGEITKSSEMNTTNLLEDNQNAESLDTKLDENVAMQKLEQALYDSSDSHQENYSI
jgi:hypothetical protein